LKNEKIRINSITLKPDNLAELVKIIEDGTISGKIAKDILPELLSKGGSPKELVEKKGLIQISDTKAIEAIIDEVLGTHPEELAKYRSGKIKLKGFFVGQVMKKTQGRADPKMTNQLISKKLEG